MERDAGTNSLGAGANCCLSRDALTQAQCGSAEPRSGRSRSDTDVQSDPGAAQPARGAKAACGLTKEYVNGALTFRDTCTGEWAQQQREAEHSTDAAQREREAEHNADVAPSPF